MTMSDHGRPTAGDLCLVPSPARIYDYYLDGRNHVQADRAAAARISVAFPYARAIAKANRRFLTRAVHLMARRGIDQFIDLGCGLSASPDVHAVARLVEPGARVLYVDNDPSVRDNNPALQAADDKAVFLAADIRNPRGLLARLEECDVIDLTRPVGVLLVAVLHSIDWQDAPYLAVTTLTERLAGGSYLAISHITSHGTDRRLMDDLQAACQHSAVPVFFRKRHEILAFFQGLDLIRPGLADVAEWRGNGRIVPARPHQPARPYQSHRSHPQAGPYPLKFLCGVARKRRP
jgi:hypothetical protein